MKEFAQNMSLRKVLLVLYVLASIYGPCPVWAQAGAPWPTTEFEVFLGPPVSDRGEYSNLWDQMPSLSRPFSLKLEKDLEQALRKAAEKYQDMGFGPPQLEPIITREDGSLAYRVYVCEPSWIDWLEDQLLSGGSSDEFVLDLPMLGQIKSWWSSCSEKAAHTSACGKNTGKRNVIYFNSDHLFQGDQLSGWDLTTAAHELFHAVHASTRSRSNDASCTMGKWVTEGLADAVSIDLARELWPSTSLAALGRAKEFGIRPYNIELSHESIEYTASSFWRYLGEWNYAAQRRAGRRLGSAPGPSDHSYLVHVLNQPMENPGNMSSELEWLDRALRSTPKITTKLASVYSEFTAAFADMARTRFLPAENKKQSAVVLAERQDKFLAQVFDKCPVLKLDAQNTVNSLQRATSPAAARCFKIHVDGIPGVSSGSAVVSMTVGPALKQDLSSIHIGKSGGMEVAPVLPFLPTERSSAPGYAMISFNSEIGKAVPFIISNMAPEAGDSKAVDVALIVSIEKWTSSLTKAPSGGSKSSARTSADAQKSATSRKAVAPNSGQMASVGAGTTNVQRGGGSAGDCRPNSLRYNLCGPNLQIQLRLVPGSVAGTATNTTGGFHKQLRGSGASFGALGGEDPENIEGGFVQIRIPLIKYGESGSFDNAKISVSKEGGGGYVALSPVGIQGVGPRGSNRENRRVPTGHVTIEQYTPQVLKGSFSADLIDFEETHGLPWNVPASVARSISGSFTAPNVFARDEDFEIDDEAAREQFVGDMMDNPFMSSEGPAGARKYLSEAEIRELCDMGFDDEYIVAMGVEQGCSGRSGGPASGSQQASQIGPDCHCDCRDFASGLHQACIPRCGEVYAQCSASGAPPGGLPDIRAQLESVGMPEEVINQYIGELESMTAEERQELLELLEVFLEDQP